ncbi:ABC transporter permease [Candidatus Saccharibacteria bacterium]|nr:ABC transporter permease [Candidatus Saccharibacteria bacterium]
MYKKWCKVIFRHKLSFFSMLLALALTIAIVTLLGQLISNLLISYKDVSADNSNYDWGFSSLTSEHVSKLEEAIVTNKVDVKGAVFENLLGTGRDEYGLDIELLSARGNIDLLMNARCTEGRMPQSIEEICITQTYIDKTGTLIQIGDEISFYIQEKNASETMVTATVVGILNRYSSYSSNYCFLTYLNNPGADEAAQSNNCYFLYTDSDFESAIDNSAKLTYLLVGATDFEALSSQGIGYISTNTLYAQQMSKEQSLYSIIPILTVMCIILIVVAVGFVRLLVGVMLTLRKKDYGILYALGLSRNGIKKILAFEAAVFFSCSIFPGGIISVALQNTAYSVLEKISVTGSISREGSWIALLLSLFVVLIGVAIAYGMLYNAISKKQPSEYLSQSSDDVNSTEKKQAKRITNGYLLSVESNISRNPMRSMGILIICFVTSLMLMIAIDMASFLSVDAMDIVRE